jgi:excisionase family DNA binding protein
MLTVPEAARRVNRDPETVRRWIRSGKLRARKIGTQHVIEEDDLLDVAESHMLLSDAGWSPSMSA